LREGGDNTEIQKLKAKNQNDNSKCKNVVRGFSLVPGQDCTTLKGRLSGARNDRPERHPVRSDELCFVIWTLNFIWHLSFDIYSASGHL
jgi:hypothetical protein